MFELLLEECVEELDRDGEILPRRLLFPDALERVLEFEDFVSLFDTLLRRSELLVDFDGVLTTGGRDVLVVRRLLRRVFVRRVPFSFEGWSADIIVTARISMSMSAARNLLVLLRALLHDTFIIVMIIRCS